jgi:hypothetical protein
MVVMMGYGRKRRRGGKAGILRHQGKGGPSDSHGPGQTYSAAMPISRDTALDERRRSGQVRSMLTMGGGGVRCADVTFGCRSAVRWGWVEWIDIDIDGGARRRSQRAHVACHARHARSTDDPVDRSSFVSLNRIIEALDMALIGVCRSLANRALLTGMRAIKTGLH